MAPYIYGHRNKIHIINLEKTQPLFDEPFEKTGSKSAQIDRIAMARAGDYRKNQFSRWGVR